MLEKLKNIKSKEIIAGYFGKFFHGKNMTIAFWNVKKNSKIPKHNHLHEQCLYVKEGSFELKMGGKTINVSKDELIFIPSNKPHSGIAITDCELIDIFSPNRTEYSNL